MLGRGEEALQTGAPWELGELIGLTGMELSEGLCAVPQSLLWKALCVSAVFSFPVRSPEFTRPCSQAELLPRFTERVSSSGKLPVLWQIPLCLSARIKT